MKVNYFENKITIQSSAPAIFQYLADYNNMVHLHPLIIAIKEIPSGYPDKKKLEITDKILILDLIPIYKKYQATMQIVSPNECMILETFTSPKIHVKNTLKLQPNGHQTLVQENTLVETPSFIERFVLKQIKFSHTTMLVQLKKNLEKIIDFG